MNKNTIFITGASGEVGGAVARLFQKKGWDVHAFLRSLDKQETKKLVALPRVFAYKSNPESQEEMDNTIEKISKEGVVPKVFFHCAGTFLWDDGFPNYKNKEKSFEEVRDILLRSNLQTKLTAVGALRKFYAEQFNSIKQFFVGSHAANFAFDGPERNGLFKEEAYVEATQKVKKLGETLILEGSDSVVLEPGLIDTIMAREAFIIERLGFEPDWTKAYTPESYAQTIFPEEFFKARQ